MVPHSRGRLWLRSADPAVAPVIDYHHLSNPADRAALRAAADIARDLLARMPSCVPERWNPARGEDDDAWLHARLGTSQHLAGTAPMGVDDDPFAVVDEHGSVRGVTGLSVADPSIAPAPISRGMHATAVDDRRARGESAPPPVSGYGVYADFPSLRSPWTDSITTHERRRRPTPSGVAGP